MQRVIAPGLPPWPPLMFDKRTRTACVIARHATWRSYEAGLRMTKVLVYVVRGGILYLLWITFMRFDCGFLLGSVLLILHGLLFICANELLTAVLPQVLARQIFAKRTAAYFSSQAIAFRTGLYAKGVVIWRTWQGQPVKGKFILQPDQEAAAHERNLASEKRTDRHHLSLAHVLHLVITTINPAHIVGTATQSNILRAIPLVELDARDAAKFTIVYTAAASLTSLIQTPVPESSRTGIDIDLS